VKNALNTGGLYQCCVEFVENYDDSDTPNGTELTCPQCNATIVLKSGLWQWSGMNVHKVVNAPSNADWPEDYANDPENRYLCRCDCCKLVFQGHKRRVTCKTCAVN
jgi:hypothetical protein